MTKKVFIIAELSANHGHSIETAKATIQAAKRAGADAIKLQTYTADTITLNCDAPDFVVSGGTLWDGRKLYDLYQEAYTPWEWHAELFTYAKLVGLTCFSSPFDSSAVDFLETLNCPIYKIASFEITDIPLINYVARLGKSMILSTGIAEYNDIALAIETCHRAGNRDLTLLKCTSAYPAPLDEVNLCMMAQFQQDFAVKIGLSDHTLGSTLPALSVLMGASVIEKHFILDRSIGGPDAAFSLDESEFTEMVRAVREVEAQLSKYSPPQVLAEFLAAHPETEVAIGKVSYELSSKQLAGKRFARSLYVAEDVKAGEIITEKNLRSVRPGFGLHPKYLPELLGKHYKADYPKGTAFSLSCVD